MLLSATRLWGMLKLNREPLISAVEQGAPFVVNTRLRQIALEKKLLEKSNAELSHDLPLIVNLLGTRDEFIAPSDCVEPSPPDEHLFLEVPSTNHLLMLKVDDGTDEAERRREIIKLAFDGTPEEIKSRTDLIVLRDDLNDYFDELDRPESILLDRDVASVKHAVIVLHGIRDHGFWTKRIAKRIKSRGVRTLFRAPSPSYGYFSVLDFLNPRRRKRQARWLLQQYADVRSCFRDAKISFVGHSNGTYLLKEALSMSKAMELNRVYLAGSVLRRDLDWDEFGPQIKEEILNIKSTGDWVVGCLPSAMERMMLKFLDVGGAGFYGFTGEPKTVKLIERSIKGSHNSGISEKAWNGIANFIVDGTVPPDKNISPTIKLQSLVRFAPILLLLALGFFIYLVDRGAVLLSYLVSPMPSIVSSLSAGTLQGSVQVGFIVLLLLLFSRIARVF